MSAGSLSIWLNRTYATNVHLIDQLRHNSDGVGVRIIATHTDPTSPVLAVADLACPEPDTDNPASYLQFALDFCVRNSVDVFIPRAFGGAIAASRADFDSASVALVCPSPSAIAVCEDKAALYRAVEPLGVPVPPWRVADTAEGFLSAVSSLGAEFDRLCVKPVNATGAMGFRQLRHTRPQFDELMRLAGLEVAVADVAGALADAEGSVITPLMVMPYLDEPEISVDVLATPEGSVLAAVPRAKQARLRWLPDDPAAIGIAARIVGEFSIGYLSNVQLRFCNGEPVLLEVNPRPSGGLYQTAWAGVEIAWAAVKLAVYGDAGELHPRPGARYVTVEGTVPLPGNP